MNIAYQCSICENLYDLDEYVMCMADVDPRTNHRQKGDADKCKKAFTLLAKKDRWHEPFKWETMYNKV